MTDNTTLKTFLAETKSSQKLWALQEKSSEDWVVADSPNYENTEVMPLWSNAELAKLHCVDEWCNFVPCKIMLADWFEFWVEDLNEDGVTVGINWEGDEVCLEMDLADFTLVLSEIESLK